MRMLTRFLAMALCLTSSLALASPEPCRFGGITEKSTTVDITSVYKAADAVVIGKVTGRESFGGSDLIFQVERSIKGISGKEITLHGQRTENTEVNGYVLPGGRDVLLFLKSTQSGIYENVENFNSPCNITSFIKDGKVVLIEKDDLNPGLQVAVDEIKAYLDSAPESLVFNYK